MKYLARVALAIFCIVFGACAQGKDQGSEPLLRGLVDIKLKGADEWIRLTPGPIDFDSDAWATHDVTVEIGSDDLLPTFLLPDSYAIGGEGSIRPSPGARSVDYSLSDVTMNTAKTRIRLMPLEAGTHVIDLSIPIHLEPNHRFDTGLEPVDTTAEIELTYTVFPVESEFDYYCARADQLLWQDTFRFDASAFAEEGSGILTNRQLTLLQEAGMRFDDLVETNFEWDPSELFDLVEDICDVTYNERWHAIS